MNKVVYVAGPYRGKSNSEVERNIRMAWLYSRYLWEGGDYAICPHKNTEWMDDASLTPSVFISGDLEILSRCDEVHVLPGYESSEGTNLEIQRAHELGKRVYYVTQAMMLSLVIMEVSPCAAIMTMREE